VALESLAAVSARIGEIQQQMGTNPPVSAMPFAAVLEGAQARLASASDPALTVRAPAALEPYRNGRIPESALVPVGVGQQRLWGPAAQAFQRMAASAAASGVRIDVTDSYRSYGAQVDVARRKGLYSQGGLAAQPGTSTHGWGLSVDVDTNGGSLAWRRRNGAEFGFVEDVDREPWHWTYKGSA
jgi:D-alanyl-D-alanine carboxypeptidase